jgi:hypothetical protein
MNDND